MTVHGFARSGLLLISGTTIVHFIAALYTDVKNVTGIVLFLCVYVSAFVVVYLCIQVGGWWL